MTNMIKLRVHVCPIGYEIDRIVESAKQLCAEKVWLIVEKDSSKEKASKFITKVESLLEKNSIHVEQKAVSRGDLFDNLKGIKEIFEDEKGNEIKVNVSAGSKIQAIAGMMACMMFKEFNATPYYVEPKKYETPPKPSQSTGIKEIIPLPDYAIQKPEDELIQTLRIIKNNNEKLNKKSLAKFAIEEGLIDSKNEKVTQSDYAKLDHRIIKPLEEKWKFISVKKLGVNHWIELTDTGKDACKFLI